MLVTNFIDKKATKFHENSVILNDISKLVVDIQQNLLI